MTVDTHHGEGGEKSNSWCGSSAKNKVCIFCCTLLWHKREGFELHQILYNKLKITVLIQKIIGGAKKNIVPILPRDIVPCGVTDLLSGTCQGHVNIGGVSFSPVDLVSRTCQGPVNMGPFGNTTLGEKVRGGTIYRTVKGCPFWCEEGEQRLSPRLP